jgi:hypothetical protein
MNFGIKIDDTGARRAIATRAREVRRTLLQAANRIGSEFVRRIREDQFTGYTGAARPDKLQVRSGDLRRHVRMSVNDSAGAIVLRLEVLPDEERQARYGSVHEFGATLQPRNAQFMTIPVGDSLTPTGQTREQWRPRRGSDGKWYVNGYRSFIFTAANGKTYIGYRTVRARGGRVRSGQRRPTSRDVRAAWRLERTVTLPPGRMGFHRTWDEMAPFREKVLTEELAKLQ